MDFSGGGGGTGRNSPSHGLGASSRSQGGGSQVLGMTGGTSMRAQLDSLSMTVHEVVGRIELSGRQILMLCVAQPQRLPAKLRKPRRTCLPSSASSHTQGLSLSRTPPCTRAPIITAVRRTGTG
jgi:hypothetical protein